MDDLTIERLWDRILIQPQIQLKCANRSIMDKLKMKLSNYKYKLKESNPELGLDGFMLSFNSREQENETWILVVKLIEVGARFKELDGIELLEDDEDETT